MRLSLVVGLTVVVASCGPPSAPAAPAAEAPSPANTPRAEPEAPVSTSHIATAIACGDYHTCVRMDDGTARCWGRDVEGQLGDGGGGTRSTPIAVPGVRDVTSLALSANGACALSRGAKLRCWGTGVLLRDDPRAQTRLRPTLIESMRDVRMIAAGGLLACALSDGGTGAVRCWGDQAAQPDDDLTDVEELAVAGAHACARIAKGEARCWGDPPWNDKLRRPKLRGASQIATGDDVACAIVSGGIRCWGRNEQGQLGSKPDMELHVVPSVVPGVRGATAIAAGEAHVCAIVDDGGVRCWGSNTDGELGRGAKSTSETPAPVKGLGKVVEVSLGADHACARKRDGSVWCWGSNAMGQIGDGTTEERLTPTRVAL